MKCHILFVSLLITVAIESKPLDLSTDSETINDVDSDNDEKIATIRDGDKNLITNSNKHDGVSSKIRDDVKEASANNEVANDDINSINDVQNVEYPNLVMPLLQRWQFTPQLFFQERLKQLRDSLERLGLGSPIDNSTNAKTLTTTTNGLLNLIGLNDSGSYTDGKEPAGLLGGNGWFANKGGILGGPGAIFSTGSILTDYPTAYK